MGTIPIRTDESTEESRQRFDIKLENGWVDHQIIGFGVDLFTFFAKEFSLPVGMVWGNGMGGLSKSTFDIGHVYVLPVARKKGVASAILKNILESYDVLQSKEGTTLGAAFMQKFGFKYNEELDYWFYIKDVKEIKDTKPKK